MLKWLLVGLVVFLTYRRAMKRPRYDRLFSPGHLIELSRGLGRAKLQGRRARARRGDPARCLRESALRRAILAPHSVRSASALQRMGYEENPVSQGRMEDLVLIVASSSSSRPPSALPPIHVTQALSSLRAAGLRLGL